MKHFFFISLLLIFSCSLRAQFGSAMIMQAAAGIDTSFQSGDSVFIVTITGDTIFTGINADNQNATQVALSPAINYGGVNTTTVQAALAAIDLRLDTAMNSVNQGAIVYVSKNGSDATGTRGDFFKPYLTISAAITAATAGDLIVVYPGVYSEATDLASKTLNYYFYGKASCSGCLLSGGKYVTISGNGTFYNTGSNSQAFLTSSSYTKYSIECDSMNINQLGVPPNMSFDADIKVKHLLFSNNNGNLLQGFLGGVPDTSRDYTINIKCNVLEQGSIVVSGGAFIGGNFARRKITVVADKVISRSHEFHSSGTHGGNNMYCLLDFGEVVDSYSGTPKGCVFMWGSGAENLNNFHFEIRIKRFITNDYILGFISNTGANQKNAFYVIDCEDCVYTDTSSALFIASSASTFPRRSTMPFIIKGNYTASAGGSILRQYQNSISWEVPLNLVGTFKTTSTTISPFRFRSIVANKVNFESGTKVIVGSSAIAPVTAVTSANIYCLGALTNSTTVDANVIENILPFTRNTNVR